MTSRLREKEIVCDNITLIGMPASGKSSVGVILAKVIGYDFVDVDILIQKEEKRKLSRIIAEEGVDRFIEIETRVGKNVNVQHTVIATGGSAVYGREAMEHFRQIGVIIYLKICYNELFRRLHNIEGRGVVLRDGQTLRDIYNERSELYEKYADIVIEEHDNIEDCVVDIVQRLSRK